MPDNDRARRIASPWGELVFTPVAGGAGGAADGQDTSRSMGSRPAAPSVRQTGPDPTRRADGRPRASRAAQFMPFAALTGYYELVREQERVIEPRHELTEDESERLSHAFARVRRGDLVRLTYYDRDGYRTRAGRIEDIDEATRQLRMNGRYIAFDDIWCLWAPDGRSDEPDGTGQAAADT